MSVQPDRSASGKRERHFFPTKGEAKNFAAAERDRQAAVAEEDRGLSAEERAEAWRCLKICRAHGFTLAEAVEDKRRAVVIAAQSIPVPALVAEVIADKKAKGKSKTYLQDLTNRLQRFAADHADKLASDLTAPGVEDWLRALPNSGAVTQNNFLRLLNVMMEHALKRGYVASNPLSRVEKLDTRGGEIHALTVAEAESLLRACDDALLPVIAIGLFAGIRPEETMRLDWRHIHWPHGDKPGNIEVKALHAKTGQRRLVRILPNLQAWLAPFGERTGAVYPGGKWNYYRRLPGLRTKAGVTRWPNDVLRHSFCSYHIAKFNDAAFLALQMGHASTRLIFTNYREVVHPDAAERYFNLLP